MVMTMTPRLAEAWAHGASTGLSRAPVARTRAGVLFVCDRNSVRSPMAAALLCSLLGHAVHVESAGVWVGQLNHFAVDVMREIGIDLSEHEPTALDNLEYGPFGLIVTLAPAAHHQALEFARNAPTQVEYWATEDPALADGHREQILDSYRNVRDRLNRRIRQRFLS